MNSSKSDASAEHEKELRWSPLGDGGGEKTRREEEAKTTLMTREHFHNSALSYFDFLVVFCTVFCSVLCQQVSVMTCVTSSRQQRGGH